MKQIELQNKLIAIVDEEDYERVNEFLWYVSNNRVYNAKNGHLGNFIMRTEHTVSKRKKYLDYRKENLVVIKDGSFRQTSKGNKGSSSTYKGVSWCKNRKKWVSNIRVNNNLIRLGSYDDEEEAALVYNDSAIKHFGNHAYQNVIGINNNATKIKTGESIARSSKAGFRGVYYDEERKEYQVEIAHSGKRYRLGRFKEGVEAGKAYDRKAIELHGDQAILNFPEDVTEVIAVSYIDDTIVLKYKS